MYTEIFHIDETLYLTIKGICSKDEMDILNIKLINFINKKNIKNIVINLEDLTSIDINSFNILETL